MAKLEEIAELLTDEINDFNKGISKLEKINDQISTTKIHIDLTDYKSIIEMHQQKMNNQISSQERFEKRFESLLKTAKVYPNWAVIIFIISFLFGLGSLAYVYNVTQTANTLEKEAYKKGIIDANMNFQSFFENHPKSKKNFEKWESNK